MMDDVADELAAAVAALTDVLLAENAALVAMDLAAAGAMLGDKQRAAARFAAARPDEAGPESLRIVAELRDLAERNRRLLEHGMLIQGRLIGMVAQAAKEHSAAELPAYGARGAARARPMPAVALAARA